MLLLSGPPGAGKTQRVLQEVRRRLAGGTSDFRLLVPTFTMAEHLRHELAREGWGFRPSLVLTLAKFVDEYAADLPAVSDETLLLTVEAALARLPAGEFRALASYSGFQTYLADLLQEFSAAGCDAGRLASLPLDSSLQRSFLRVYHEVEACSAERGQALAGTRLRHAAARIASAGLPGVSAVFFDGFFSFTAPELAVIDAVRRHAALTVTLPPWAGNRAAHEQLLAMGLREEAVAGRRAAPEVKIVEAPTLDREATEIARRILLENDAGRPFREMGVVVRSRDPYVAALRLVFERFGIPARFYFADVLAAHPVVRFFRALVTALLGGWEHEATLAALRGRMSNRAEWIALENLPGRGLDTFQIDSVLRESLRSLEAWKAGAALPAVWAERVPFLQTLVHDVDETPDLARARTAALKGFAAAAKATADGLGADREIGFAEFWRELEAVLNRARLRVNDQRRNVVHVLDVYEARQWELPVVFVCGLLERQFPRYAPQDAIFPDDARRRFAAHGVALATSADKEREERFLFDLAATRATSTLVLSYPKFNAKGQENLVSFFLDEMEGAREAAIPVRPRAARARAPERKAAIFNETLRAWLAERNTTFSATGLESFLQCPFQYFARRSLRLASLPARPEARLDPPLQGEIVHAVIAKWTPGADLDALFEAAFRNSAKKHRVPPTYRTEALRLEMLRNLRRFVAEFPAAAGYTLFTEVPFTLVLAEGLAVRGRIDRYDVGEGGAARIIDYKYSGAARIRKRMEGHEAGFRIQGGLYVLALQRVLRLTPAAMYFWGFRGELTWRGWTEPEELQHIAQEAGRLAVESAQHIREGGIAVAPADEDECQYCDFRDGCRVGAGKAVAAGESEWS
jgi:ATP-dependent helicase/DNAse subunit B